MEKNMRSTHTLGSIRVCVCVVLSLLISLVQFNSDSAYSLTRGHCRVYTVTKKKQLLTHRKFIANFSCFLSSTSLYLDAYFYYFLLLSAFLFNRRTPISDLSFSCFFLTWLSQLTSHIFRTVNKCRLDVLQRTRFSFEMLSDDKFIVFIYSELRQFLQLTKKNEKIINVFI